MILLKYFLLGIKQESLIHSINLSVILTRLSTAIFWNVSYKSISVRNHQGLVNSLIHIIPFELKYSVLPNI